MGDGMKKRLITLLSLTMVALAACNPLARDPVADAQVRQAYSEIRKGDVQALTARFAPEAKSSTTTAQLAQVQRLVPKEEPRSRKVVGTSTVFINGAATLATIDEYDYGDRVVRVDARLHRAGSGPWEIQGFHVQLASAKALEANNFNFFQKSARHYLILAITVGVPLLMTIAVVKVLRTQELRHKWLWVLLALLGLGKVQMNWATGAFAYQIATAQLIGFGVLRGPSSFDPWFLTFTLPIGALLILSGLWANPRRGRAKEPLSKDAETPPPPVDREEQPL